MRELLKMDPTAEGFRLNVDSLGVEGGQVQVSGDLPHRSQDGPCREGMGVVRSTGSLLQVVQGITQSCKRAQQESSRSPGVCEKDPPSKSRVVEDQGGVRLRTLPFGHGLDVEEIEVLSLTTNSFLVDHMGKKVTLNLLVSKSDQDAVGVKRTLQCVCSSNKCKWDCPFRVTLDVVCKVEKFNGTGSQLCIRRDRKMVTKHALVSAWCIVFQMKVGGHSGRRSGALHYVRQPMHDNMTWWVHAYSVQWHSKQKQAQCTGKNKEPKNNKNH